MNMPPRPLHEPLTSQTRAIQLFAAGLVAFLIVTSIAMWVLYVIWLPKVGRHERARQQTAQARFTGPVPAAPLSSTQRREREEYEAAQQKLLSTYGWTDEDRQFARVPIDRAMQLMLERKPSNE